MSMVTPRPPDQRRLLFRSSGTVSYLVTGLGVVPEVLSRKFCDRGLKRGSLSCSLLLRGP